MESDKCPCGGTFIDYMPCQRNWRCRTVDLTSDREETPESPRLVRRCRDTSPEHDSERQVTEEDCIIGEIDERPEDTTTENDSEEEPDTA